MLFVLVVLMGPMRLLLGAQPLSPLFSMHASVLHECTGPCLHSHATQAIRTLTA